VGQIEVPDLASPQSKANPYPFYARLRAEAPVYHTRVPIGGMAQGESGKSGSRFMANRLSGGHEDDDDHGGCQSDEDIRDFLIG
jgi:hypothetical protein